MKIIISALNFYPEMVGNAKYTSEMVFWLSEYCEELIVITTNPYYPQWRCLENKYKKEERKNLKIFRCPVFIPKKINGFTKILHYMSFFISSFPIALSLISYKPDLTITICPTFFSVPSMLLTSFCSRVFFKKKVYSLLHYQDLEIEAAFNLNILRGRYLKKLILFVEKILINRFSIVSTISTSMIQKISSKINMNTKSLLLPNFVNTKKFESKGENPFLNEFGIEKDVKVIMYSGSINEKLAIDTLIDAIFLLKNEKKILWIISGEGPLKNYLIDKLKGINNVRIKPFQPSNKFPDWINLGAIHLAPQKLSVSNLVLPSKLLAILSSSKPVIGIAPKSSDLGKILDIAGIRLSDEDPNLLARAIMKLIKNDKLRVELGRKGNKYVKQFHEKDKVLSDFLLEIEQTMN